MEKMFELMIMSGVIIILMIVVLSMYLYIQDILKDKKKAISDANRKTEELRSLSEKHTRLFLLYANTKRDFYDQNPIPINKDETMIKTSYSYSIDELDYSNMNPNSTVLRDKINWAIANNLAKEILKHQELMHYIEVISPSGMSLTKYCMILVKKVNNVDQTN